MTTGAFALTNRGGRLLGEAGGRRLSWMGSTASRPLFAVLFIDEVSDSYYNPSGGVQENADKLDRWLRDVAEYEEWASEVTRRDLWSDIIILLVHVEKFAASGPSDLWPLTPPGDVPYPSHIMPPDRVIMKRWRAQEPGRVTFGHFRQVLEQAASPVMPRFMRFDTSGSMDRDNIRPGLTHWMDYSTLRGVTINGGGVSGDRTGEQWVKWATEALQRLLA